MRSPACLPAILILTLVAPAVGPAADRPNIVLLMADDLGWGDVGFHGNRVIRTPHLDEMAQSSLRFNRFYAAAPVCSPTRGSCLTGRHPYRYGVYSANVGHLKAEEVTLSQVLKQHGYATGHFGKWHLGTLTTSTVDGRRGGRPQQAPHYSPPWERGFDVCFSTEVQMPTWNPVKNQNFPSKYWTGPEQYATENLDGDDSRVIVDRAIPFMHEAARRQQPFFAVIWFHTPHEPVVGGPDHLALYEQHPDPARHYFACVTALDEQVGRLRDALRELEVADNTMVWFTSDNGPAGRGGGTAQQAGGRQQGSAGPYRGRKGSLFEGGVRVPGLLEWPARIQPGETELPSVTSDYLPTILALLGAEMPDQRPLDGIDLLPLIDRQSSERPRPIGFQSGGQLAWSDNRFKLVRAGQGQQWMLFDLRDDPGEQRDLAAEHPERVAAMRQQLEAWLASCQTSGRGGDYARRDD